MIPPEIFGALRLASHETSTAAPEGIYLDGRLFTEPLPAELTAPAFVDLTDAEITYDGHTAAIRANPGS